MKHKKSHAVTIRQCRPSPSSAVRTPFKMIGKLVIDFNHLISCYRKFDKQEFTHTEETETQRHKTIPFLSLY
jgi:hypothetical protein